MAALTQTISVPADAQRFSGIPFGSNNIYPRARINFNSATAITLKAAGNTKTVIFTMDLPPNFAYRLDSSYVNFNLATNTEVSQYEDLGIAIVSLDITAGSVFMRMALESKGAITDTTVAGGQKSWTLIDPITEVLQADASNIQIIYHLFDNDGVNETVALGLDFHVSFLQYDILQVTDVSVNAPLPVSLV